MNYPMLWLMLLIFFAGIEGVTAGLISIWFCVGSLAALIAAWLGAPLAIQIGLFAVVSVIAMALVRPVAKRLMHPAPVPTNADRIIGQEGVVVEEIDDLHATGQIKVGGAIWTARTVDGAVLPVGSLVCVERIEGVKAIVSERRKER